MRKEERINILLLLYLNGTITTSETVELASLTKEVDENVLQEALEQAWLLTEERKALFTEEEAATMLQGILQVQTKKNLVVSLFSKKWWYAASAAAVLLAGFFVIYKFAGTEAKPSVAQQPNSTLQQDVKPGGNRAVLMLADGSEIVLDSASNGLLAEQGNGKVMKTKEGLRYQAGTSDEELYNTIQTPHGGEYHVVLSDGTQVWLNASSSFRFPIRFTGKERSVELEGEGYFEVAKNTSQPFKVSVAGKGEVEVLGTHFNVNAYEDEDRIKTTLLEGSVKFSVLKGQETSVTMMPGQQSQLSSDGKLQLVNDVNMEEAVAWKNGQFYFESADLKTILRQFKRWYDVEVVYEATVSNRKYFAIISKKSTLLEVLKALQANDIKYRIEGKKLIVLAG